MADIQHPIDEARSAAGRRILDMMDSVGFDAYAAAWIHDRPTQTWRYLLSTPMLKTEGPLWVYRHLMKVFKHLPLPEGVSPLDVFVIDPEYEMALFGNQIMGAEVKNSNPKMPPGIYVAINYEIVFESFSVTNGFASFYRRVPEVERHRRKNPSRTFDHKVAMLKAA